MSSTLTTLRLFLAGLCAAAGLAVASPGDLDTSFGDGTGRVFTDYGSSFQDASGVALQSNGDILTLAVANSEFAVFRYSAAGVRDANFGIGGRASSSFGSARASGFLTRSDGKFVVAGFAFNAQSNVDFALVRFLPDGTKDPTFNGGGVVLTDFGQDADVAYGIAVQSDGKFLLAGDIRSGTKSTFALARYTADGSLDRSFNRTGKVITDLGGSNATAACLAVQPNGRIVAAGSVVNGNVDTALVRYLKNGRIDRSFNRTGKVVTSMVPHNDSADCLVLQKDGKILVAGAAYNGSDNDFAVARYLPNGQVDPSFNGTGKIILDLGGTDDLPKGIALQSDGRIVVAGTKGWSPNRDVAVVRFLPNGTLDASFGNNGVAQIDFYGGDDQGKGVAVQPDGKIVVAGSSAGGGMQGIAIARLIGDAQLEARTTAATGVGIDSAVLRGTVDANGLTGATAFFEWGTSAGDLRQKTTPVPISANGGTVEVQALLNGLARGTGYFYRLRIETSESAAEGAVRNFATITQNAPGVISEPASSITTDGAELTASINPNGLPTTGYFQWGASEAYGQVTAEVDCENRSVPTPISATLSGLTTGQTYHFRAVATSEAGTTVGPDRVFTPSASAPHPQDDVVLIDGAATIRVLANDDDPSGGGLSLVALDSSVPPTAGTARIVGELILYTPNDGMLEDEFGYVVQDVTGKTARARVRAYRLSEIRGQYFGVIVESAGSGQLNLEITPGGAFSLLLTWQGLDYAAKGRFDGDRSFFVALPRKGSEPDAVLLLELQFDPISQQIVARLTDTVLGGPFVFAAPRGGEADAIVDAVRGQLYTTSIDVPDVIPSAPEEGSPETISGFADKFRGSGFASVKIAKNRSARFVGQMPDTEKFSAGSPISRRSYAFYSALYRAKKGALGSVSGQATLQSNFELRSTSLNWQREADERDEIFAGKFSTPAFLNGDRYTPPTRGQLMQIGLELASGAFSNARLSMSLGGLSSDVHQALKFIPNSVRVVGENPSGVKLRISPQTGTFAGTFTHNVSGKTMKFSGIFITSPFQIREGRGSFRGEGSGGKVRIAKP